MVNNNTYNTPHTILSKNIRKNHHLEESLNKTSHYKYYEDHLSNLKNLKESLERNYELYSHNNQNLKTFGGILTGRNKNPYEFTFNKIPHIDGKQKEISPKFILYKDRLQKCIRIDTEEDAILIKNIENFEKDAKLPTIGNICNQKAIKNVALTIKRNKIMGERYNPLNFYHDKLRSTTKRNFYGALFQH